MRYCLPICVVCVSSHLCTVPRQIWFWTNLTKSWDSVRPPSPLYKWVTGIDCFWLGRGVEHLRYDMEKRTKLPPSSGRDNRSGTFSPALQQAHKCRHFVHWAQLCMPSTCNVRNPLSPDHRFTSIAEMKTINCETQPSNSPMHCNG